MLRRTYHAFRLRGLRLERALAETIGARERPPRLPYLRLGPRQSQTFFGYYDVTPFSADESRVLAHVAPPAHRPPDGTTHTRVGYYRVDEPERFYELGRTRLWSWQLGSRLQWTDEQGAAVVVYNREVDGGLGAVIQDPATGEIVRELARPIFCVVPGTSQAVSLCFGRLYRLRPGYGYARLSDPTRGERAPRTEGVWLLDLRTGQAELIWSLEAIARFETLPGMDGAEHYVNHVLPAPGGERVAFTHVWVVGTQRYTRLLTCRLDGTAPCALVNEGHASHAAWRSAEEILVYSTHADSGRSLHLYRDGSAQRRAVLPDVVREDGHPTFMPGGNRFVIDTYPDPLGDQHLFEVDLERGSVRALARLYSPAAYRKDLRCDLHPRISSGGRYVCVDTTESGRRQVAVIDLGGGTATEVGSAAGRQPA